MSDHAINLDRLFDLVGTVCDEDALQGELTELDSVVFADQVACHNYLRYCRMHSALRLELRAHRATQAACQQIDIEFGESAPDDFTVAMDAPPSPMPLGFLRTPLHGTIGFFSQELPFSLLIATIITGLGLLMGSFIYVSHHRQLANSKLPPLPSTQSLAKSRAEYVGRITGMVDVKWSDTTTAAVTDLVALGRKYAMASGMMEITYDTGAKIVLQGPVTYEAESRDGGFLSVGKLTARVEKGAEVRRRATEAVNQESELSAVRSSLFTIRTPTAVITDLGTEFSVDVRPDKTSEIHVIRGMVETSRDRRTGGKPVRERLVAGEGIQFLALDEPPRRIAVDIQHVHRAPPVDKIVRDVHNARIAPRVIAPTGIVATAYRHVWDVNGKPAAENDRQLAFQVATDGEFGRGEKGETPKSCFDTLTKGLGTRDWGLKGGNGTGAETANSKSQISNSSTVFVGLLYGRKMQFDRIKVFLARQTDEGGGWSEMPKLFILKNPVDTNQTPPENDPNNWQELSLHSLYTSFNSQSSTGPGAVIELVLSNTPAKERTGYGWAMGGVRGNGSCGYVSVTELRAYIAPLLQEDP